MAWEDLPSPVDDRAFPNHDPRFSTSLSSSKEVKSRGAAAKTKIAPWMVQAFKSEGRFCIKSQLSPPPANAKAFEVSRLLT